MKISGVIFDLDGTLGDTVRVGLEAFRATFLKYTSKHYTDDEIFALWGPTEEGIFISAAPDKWQEYMQTFLTAYDQVHTDLQVGAFPGIHEIIQLLQENGVRVAVVTAKGPQSATISLSHFELNGAFEYVETGSSQGLNKAERIEYVAEKWGIPKKQILYVGDFPSDITVSREAGVVPVSAAWGPYSDGRELASHNPDYLFHTTGDFLQWLAKHLKDGF
ncbi:MAG: HAD family hydrolase [Anaerolineales bacterium]|jgi:pyrophosphatase PpaX